MHRISQPEWALIAAHRLQLRWRSFDPGQRKDVVAELWNDPHLTNLDPERAVDAWLTPIFTLPPLQSSL